MCFIFKFMSQNSGKSKGLATNRLCKNCAFGVEQEEKLCKKLCTEYARGL